MDLSLNLKAFVSQRLIPTVDGKHVAAIEILLGTPLVCDLIMKGDILAGQISLAETLRNTDSPSNLKINHVD